MTSMGQCIGPLLQALFELREDHPVDPDGKEAARDFHDDFQILSLAMHDTTGVRLYIPL